ncbi:MAG TPA: hypothetical protein VIV84_06820, partial [Burkholderiaceae bacterium]
MGAAKIISSESAKLRMWGLGNGSPDPRAREARSVPQTRPPAQGRRMNQLRLFGLPGCHSGRTSFSALGSGGIGALGSGGIGALG